MKPFARLCAAVLAVLAAMPCAFCADTVLVRAPEVRRVERGNVWQTEFELPGALPAGESVHLELDARVDYPLLNGHNATAMTVFVNDRPVPAQLMVNCPIEFRRANGQTGEAGRWLTPKWNAETRKTGKPYVDLMLRKGGDAYGLAYSPDFESIDSDKYPYRSPGFSRTHFVFDLTSMVKPGKNVLTVCNNISASAVPAMGNKSPLDLAIRDIKLFRTDRKAVKPRPFWLAELDEANTRMPWIAPTRDWSEKYSFTVDDSGLLTVSVAGLTYQVRSTFSYPKTPQSRNGFPRPATAEPSWQVQKSVADDRSVTLKAAGSTYKIERTVTPGENALEIVDTVTNLTEHPQPIFTRHQVRLGAGETVWLSGLQVAPGQTSSMYFPENPTAFAESASGAGLGIAPYDDVLRIHSAVLQIQKEMEIRDRHLVIAPGKSVRLVWQVFPVNAGGYMRFVNNLRHRWKLASPEVNGCFWHHILKPVAPDWKPKAGVETVSIFNTFKGRYLWGSAVAGNQPYEAEKLEIIASLRRAAPSLKIMASYMAIYFSNGGDGDLERFKDCVVVNRSGKPGPTEAGCRFFIPTRTNAFGKMVENTIDRMIDVWKVDGIYFDYMEGADPYYTYNQYDGVSGDINEADGSLQTVKGSYQLLSQDFLIYLLKKIHGRGLFVRANRNNFTASTMNEINHIVPVRFTECGYPDQLARGHLAPCPMGLQRTFSNQLELQTIRALYEGMTTAPYHSAYKHGEADNPVSAMWPIAFREMRRGAVIGENKIVTAVSGHFGFGDASELAVRFYDKTGRRTAREFPRETRDGANYVTIKLETGEIAVIDRVKK